MLLSALLALYERNPPADSPNKGVVMSGLNVYFDVKQTVEQTVEFRVIWDTLTIT